MYSSEDAYMNDCSSDNSLNLETAHKSMNRKDDWMNRVLIQRTRDSKAIEGTSNMGESHEHKDDPKKPNQKGSTWQDSIHMEFFKESNLISGIWSQDWWSLWGMWLLVGEHRTDFWDAWNTFSCTESWWY